MMSVHVARQVFNMARKQNKPQVDVFFPSVQAALADMNAPHAIGFNASKVRDYQTKHWDNNRWLGFPGSFADIKQCLENGYADGERDIVAFHDKVKATLPRALGHNRAKRKAETGDELDYHAMLRGCNDRAWTQSHRAIRKDSGILRLVADIGANAHTGAHELRWRGVAAVALTHIMVKAGYSVEVVAAFAVSNPDVLDSMTATVSTVVKPRTTAIDTGLLAATVALSGFFRTVGFAGIVRACDMVGKAADNDLGHYLDVSGVLPVPDKVTQLFVAGDVCNEASAVQWTRDAVTLLQGSTR